MYLKYAAALASVLPLALAQTYTDCNPLEKDCKPDPGLNSKTFSSDFTQGDSALDGWIKASGDVSFGPDGAEFTVNKKGDAPTIETDSYIFFGKVEVEMKAAPGTGIVSTIVIESDVLDEIDWETLGGDTTQVQTNYFGKGDTSSYDRATFATVQTPQEVFHTYTITWSPDEISWLVDGNNVRTLTRAEAKDGTRFPQTPSRVRIGIWAGGDSDNSPGTIEWAGGETDYSAAPFTMYIKSVNIENTHPGNEYSYSDNSGDWQSIDVDNSKPESSSSKSESSTSTETSTSSTSSETETKTDSESSSSTTTTDSETDSPTSTSASSTSSDSSSSSSSESSGSASPTATGTGSGSGSGSASGSGSSSDSDSDSDSSSDSASGSSNPSDSEAASSTDDASDPTFTGAASTLIGTTSGLLTFVAMMAAMFL